ncbi:glycine cleavage system protein R [Endomicrobium proavitum]|uniref:Glycine cleavage system transcriptional repressor n=1 Tax=Endomicrobium proavitum TaxID=1408281 RepID=A0A0G3WFV3_9BACT|nr:ACT domain-containing protein [Endomicrobium proavitum]AKL97491.1 Glycine cleavage system transcriptional repressor [Endomicrobium proavitum]
MSKYVSLTAIGKDKPGIVGAITKVLYELNCNIEDSTMTILYGQFAMILIIKLPAKFSQKTLSSKLAKLSGLSFSYSKLSSVTDKKTKKQNAFVISVYGADKPGIVYKVSEFLAGKKINITDVQTMASKKTYIMLIEAQFPNALSELKVSKELSALAASLGVTVSLNKAELSRI